MATFSPTPASRRVSRAPGRGHSPTRRSYGGRAAYTPGHLVHDTASLASAMDVDERSSVATDKSFSRIGGDLVFSRTEEMSVSYYASLPLEVKQVLKTSDFTRDHYTGQIDTETGFALVASSKTCFVWQHAQAIKGIPTCYIFRCPADARDPRPPFHALVPQGSREPGMILISHTGQIRFWDSIAIGLAGGENFASSQLEDLEYDEEVTCFHRVDSQTFILSTTFGGLYRLALTSAGGKYHLTARQFLRPSAGRTFSRLLPSFLSSATPSTYAKDPSKHIHAIALSPATIDGDRKISVLANGQLNLWTMRAEGWEDLVSSENLLEVIAPHVQSTFKVQTDDLELSDLAASDDDRLVVLVSYSGNEFLHGFRRLYALVELESTPTGHVVQSIRSVPYQTTNQSELPVHPRIQLLYSGSIISVEFGDAVAVCARASEYRDRVVLKTTSSDRTLGVGVNLNTNHLIVLTASTMMKVFLDLDKIQNFHPETGQTDLIKSTMMQAILYGSLPMNPLRFSFPPDLNEHALMQAAEQLSNAVLRSDPEVVRSSADLAAQMGSRKERLSWLIGFINENAVSMKMTEACRQKLATDAEKLYASTKLWTVYNGLLSTSPTKNVLKEAIQAYMQQIDDTAHEDLVRAFFRLHVADLGKLLRGVADVVRSQGNSTIATTNILPEANRVVITVLSSAFDYREFNRDVYGLKRLMVHAWTSQPYLIDAVRTLVDLTTKIVDGKVEQSEQQSRMEPNIQLPELVTIYIRSMKERLDWFISMGKDSQNDATALQARFDQDRPTMLETLRRNGFADIAHRLAEEYQDFATLVSLCNKEKIYPPSENPNAELIREYVEKYKEQFTDRLFTWYIQHGEVRVLFEQEGELGPYIQKYFQEHDNLGISWLHHLQREDYEATSVTLLKDAEQSTNLGAKHLMLSIGKLACIAQAQRSRSDASERVLDAFHDDLDFVSVHEGIVQDLKAIVQSNRGKHSLDSQVEAIYSAKGQKLIERPAFSRVFKDLVRQILQGKALSVEQLVELITLKDNSTTPDEYSTSLQLLERAAALPDARKESAIKSVWRRIYLEDDWEEIQKTDDVSDEELTERYRNTALYVTLVGVLQQGGISVSPDDALDLPSVDTIASRWPGLASDQVNMLYEDYEWEQETLRELNLGDVYGRVLVLAAEAEVEDDGSEEAD